MKNMKLKSIIVSLAGVMLSISPFVASAISPLTTSCSGTPSSSNITWTATSLGGVIPVSFLWGNGSTSSVQSIAVVPGAYSMTLQATDASSTVATTTCAAIVLQSVPTITSFVANPTIITNGQNSLLSWVVSNASSTSINNGVGVVTGVSTIVTPSVTTVYQLSATNPISTTNANVTVTVNTANTGSDIQAQIQSLLNQIANLKAQLMQLLLQQAGGTATSTSPTSPLPGACFNFNRNLSRGDDGDDVKELQQTLAQDPSIFPENNVTGFFGHQTEEAVKRYQHKFGIFTLGSTTTGYFGPRSRDFFQKHCRTLSSNNDNNNDNNNGNNNQSDHKNNKSNERGRENSHNN